MGSEMGTVGGNSYLSRQWGVVDVISLNLTKLLTVSSSVLGAELDT